MMDDDKERGPPPEQSMDDILASIRRIMVDEETRLRGGADPEPVPSNHVPGASNGAAVPAPHVIMLDDSMAVERIAVEDLPPAAEILPPVPGGHPTDTIEDIPWPVEQASFPPAETTLSGGHAVVAELPAAAPSTALSAQAIEALVAPAAAAAAAASVEALLRELEQSRAPLLGNHAPTIEDVVRAELRPLLKSWLDAHLPEMVERLVRVEIERLVSRTMR